MSAPAPLQAAASSAANPAHTQQFGLRGSDPQGALSAPQQQHHIDRGRLADAAKAANSAPPVPPPTVHERFTSGVDTRNNLDPELAKGAAQLPIDHSGGKGTYSPFYKPLGGQQVRPWTKPLKTKGDEAFLDVKDQKMKAELEAKSKTVTKEELLAMTGTDSKMAHALLNEKVFRTARQNEDVDNVRFVNYNVISSRPTSDVRAKIAARIFRPRAIHVDPLEQKMRRGMVQADSLPLNARLRN